MINNLFIKETSTLVAREKNLKLSNRMLYIIYKIRIRNKYK